MRSAACAVTTLIASASALTCRIRFVFIVVLRLFYARKDAARSRAPIHGAGSANAPSPPQPTAPLTARSTPGWGCRPSVNPVADTPPAMPPARYPVSIPSRRKYWPRRAPPRSAPASAGRGLNPNAPSRNRRPSPAPRPPGDAHQAIQHVRDAGSPTARRWRAARGFCPSKRGGGQSARDGPAARREGDNREQHQRQRQSGEG